jgi:hypothetical protein
MAEDAGMVIEKVERLPEDPPSDRQLWYAKELGIPIPPDATMAEVSNLIDYYKDHDEPADDELRNFGRKYGIIFTQYMGRKNLHQHIWNCSEVQNIAWFVYCLYKDLLPKRAPQVATGPDHPVIQEIADLVRSDKQVVDSILRYSGADLAFFGQRTRMDGVVEQGGSNRTIAYERVSQLLRSKTELQMDHSLWRTSSSGSSLSSSPSLSYPVNKSKAPTPKGCMSTLLLMFAAVLIVVSLL